MKESSEIAKLLAELTGAMTPAEKKDSAVIICPVGKIDAVCTPKGLTYAQIGCFQDKQVYMVHGLTEHPDALDDLKLQEPQMPDVHRFEESLKEVAKKMLEPDAAYLGYLQQEREWQRDQREQNRLRQRYHNKHPYRK